MNIGKTLLKGLSMINYLIWFFGLSGASAARRARGGGGRSVSGSRSVARRAQEDPAAPAVPAVPVGLAHPVGQARRAGLDDHEAQAAVAEVGR